MLKVFAVNAGSSSLKYKLYEMPEEKVICSGIVERIGHDDAIFVLKFNGNQRKYVLPIKDHAEAIDLLLKALLEDKVLKSLDEINAIGHRVVQGGKYFAHSAEFNTDTETKVEKLISLAPLHNGPNLVGYRAFKKALPNVKAVAVFDTAFHQTMEPQDYMYAVPYEYYEKYDVRRYGFHGTSHLYVSEVAMKKYVDGIKHPRIITCHLGSGSSISAIKDGKCVATTMGLTPLAGVVMGTRCGDIDPSICNYLAQCLNKSSDEIYQILNKKSGLLGISGVSNDTRDVVTAMENGNERAKLAVDLFIRRVADFIGQYNVRLGGTDLIVFTAGIGENDGSFRQRICDEISGAMGVKLNSEINLPLHGKEAVISTPDSKVKVVVIPTDEEVVIARDTCSVLKLG